MGCLPRHIGRELDGEWDSQDLVEILDGFILNQLITKLNEMPNRIVKNI